MGSEISLVWDKEKRKMTATKHLVEEFDEKSVKDIFDDLNGQKKRAEADIKKFKEIQTALNKIEKEPRFKEIMEALSVLFNLKMVDSEQVKFALKHSEEQLEKIDADLKRFEKVIKEIQSDSNSKSLSQSAQ